jgi:hypothetical protein
LFNIDAKSRMRKDELINNIMNKKWIKKTKKKYN